MADLSPAGRLREAADSTGDGPPIIAVCPGTIVGGKGDPRAPLGSYVWPCVGAPGHEGECWTHAEAKDFPVPFTARDHAWLLGQVILYHGQIETMRREQAEASSRAQRQRREELALLLVASEHGNGKSGKHGPLCWLKHTYCLAKIITAWTWKIDVEMNEARKAGKA